MTPIPLNPDDLIDLAEALRRAGYDIGTQQHVAAQDLVIALAAHGRLPADPRAWRSLLAPVFCSSPAEQDDFHLHFDQWLVRRPALARQAAAFESDSIPSAARWGWLRRPRLLAAIGAALLLTAIVAAYLSTNTTYMLKGRVYSGIDGQPIAGAKIYFDDLPQPILADDKGEFSIHYRAKKLDVLRHKVSKFLRVEHPGYIARQVLVDRHPSQYQAIPLMKGVDLWKQQSLVAPGPTPSDVVPTPTPSLSPAPGKGWRDSIVGTGIWGLLWVRVKWWDVWFAVVSLASDLLWQAENWRDSNWARAAIASLPLWLFALWWLWKRYRRRMILEKLESAGTPHLDRIVVRDASERLYRGPAIRRAIQELRRHRRTQSSELDVPGTVRATIRRAGMFAPVLGMRRMLPEYLLLVERAGPHDEQARLAGEICQRLDAGGVFVDRYDFQHDPRTCRRPDPASPTLTLSDLAARHPDHCLLIFGDGAGLISPLTGEPERWIESFEQWPHRALLTPESPAHWGYREESLAENDFLLLPATAEGLASLTEFIQTGQTGTAAKWNGGSYPSPLHLFTSSPLHPFTPLPDLIAELPRRWIERQSPRPEVLGLLRDELRDYLGDEGWQWLCATAVYPAISWEITLYLGRRLLGEHPDFETDFEARLLRLVRLPWFRYGVMPDWLRSRLIESFAPGQEERVRRAIEAMLLGALETPPEKLKDGIPLEIARAEDEAKPGLFERFKRRRRLGDLLQSEPDDSPLRDYVFLSFLSGRKAPKLAVGLPGILRRVFYLRGEPIFGLRPLAGLTLAVAVAAALWFGSGVRPPVASGPPRTFAYFTTTLDAAGNENETSRRTLQAEQHVEDLGNGVTIEMVRIQGGEFQMGSSEADVQAALDDYKRYYTDARREFFTNEMPRRLVKVAPFLMGKCEVTQRQWRAVAVMTKVDIELETDPSRSRGDDLPVENVSWEQAKEFIARLNAKLGLNESKGYRLPSEAEWEYAARAGSAAPFAFGETINPSLVNYDGDYPYGKASKGLSRGRTVVVGSLGVANAWGLFDMHGNVWEWCEDVWHENYNGAPVDGRAWVEGASTGSYRVYRGGGWDYSAVICRSANRNSVDPGNRGDFLGFRLVRDGP